MKLTTTVKSQLDEDIERICKKTGLTPGVVKGVLGDCAAQKATKETQAQIATRWGLQFGNVSTIRNMGKISIEEMRDAAVTKALIISEAAKDGLMDKMNDPEQMAKVSMKDLSTISKQMSDVALNMSNNAVGGGASVNINIGDVKALIQMKNDSVGNEGKSALDRLRDRGVKVDKILEAEVVETEKTNEDPA